MKDNGSVVGDVELLGTRANCAEGAWRADEDGRGYERAGRTYTVGVVNLNRSAERL